MRTKLIPHVIFCILLGTQILPASGADEASRQFREDAAKIPNRALGLGITHIGDLDLKKLVKKIRKVKFRLINLPGFFGGSGGQRFSSVYNVSKKTVTTTPLGWNQRETQAETETLSLHEAMGALGYLDEHYEVSVPLYHLSNGSAAALPSMDHALGVLTKQVYRRATRKLDYDADNSDYLLTREGGGTGVGGGGDVVVVRAKLRLMDPVYLSTIRTMARTYFPNERYLEDSEFIRKLALIGMESTHDGFPDDYRNTTVSTTEGMLQFGKVSFRLKATRDEFGYKVILNSFVYHHIRSEKFRSAALMLLYRDLARVE